MSFDTQPRRYGPIANRAAHFTIIASLAAGCGGFSASSLMSNGSSSSDEAAEPSEERASAADGDRDREVFAGLTDEVNKKNARNFKTELRIGEIGELFAENEIFDEVAAVCGAKLWEECEVSYVPGVKVMNYTQWAFRRKDGGEVHWYPDIFHDKTEPLWAVKVIEDLLKGAHGKTMVSMVQDRCGSPVDTKCQVRRVDGRGYVLTVRDTGEVIDVWKTISEWEADL